MTSEEVKDLVERARLNRNGRIFAIGCVIVLAAVLLMALGEWWG